MFAAVFVVVEMMFVEKVLAFAVVEEVGVVEWVVEAAPAGMVVLV